MKYFVTVMKHDTARAVLCQTNRCGQEATSLYEFYFLMLNRMKDIEGFDSSRLTQKRSIAILWDVIKSRGGFNLSEFSRIHSDMEDQSDAQD